MEIRFSASSKDIQAVIARHINNDDCYSNSKQITLMQEKEFANVFDILLANEVISMNADGRYIFNEYDADGQDAIDSLIETTKEYLEGDYEQLQFCKYVSRRIKDIGEDLENYFTDLIRA